MVRCFSVRTVLPRCDLPLPGPALLEHPPLTLKQQTILAAVFKRVKRASKLPTRAVVNAAKIA